MHVAAESPSSLNSDEIPSDVKARKKILRAVKGKPANIADKIVRRKNESLL
jgi:translation elongation factor EF-Ts